VTYEKPRSDRAGLFCLFKGGITRPDELQTFLALHFGERRVDRGRKARIVELDGNVVALGFRGLFLPSLRRIRRYAVHRITLIMLRTCLCRVSVAEGRICD
jgi:hypothetical protein